MTKTPQRRGQLAGAFLPWPGATLGLLLAVGLAAAGEDAIPVVEPVVLVTSDDQDVVRYEVVLDKGSGDGRSPSPLTLNLYVRRQRVTAGWGSTTDQSELIHLDVSGLTSQGGVLGGQVQIVGVMDCVVPQAGSIYTLDAKITDGVMGGQYTLSSQSSGRRQTPLPGAGGITGRVLTRAELRQRVAPLPAGADWPCWRGPHGNGQAVEATRALVADWQQSRLVWNSEAYVAPSSAGQKPHYGQHYNGPIVAGNRVYIHCAEPDPESPQNRSVNVQTLEQADCKLQRPTSPYRADLRVRKFNASLFDEYVACVDAQTGITLWRVRLPQTGTCEGFKHKTRLYTYGSVADGRLFVCGGGSRVYAFDAATGRLLWQSCTLPEQLRAFETEKAAFLAAPKTLPLPKGFAGQLQASPVIVSGVLICPDSKNGLTGFDVEKGTRLWQVKDAIQAVYSPMKWTYQGQDYVHTGTVCLEPRSGRVTWRAKDNPTPVICGGDLSVTFTGDLMITSCGGKSPGRGGALTQGATAYRITPTSATQVWAVDKDYYGAMYSGTVSKDTYYLYTAWRSQGEAQGWKLFPVDLATGRLGAGIDGGMKECGSLMISNGLLLRPGGGGVGLFPLRDGAIVKGSGLSNIPWCTMPALADGRFFIAGFDGIQCYDLRVPESRGVK